MDVWCNHCDQPAAYESRLSNGETHGDCARCIARHTDVEVPDEAWDELAAALSAPASVTPDPVKWWLLSDIAHERNESIADVGGHCNHDESPPECIREGQATAEAYNAQPLPKEG